MRKRSIILLAGAALALPLGSSRPAQGTQGDLRQAEWLLGTWENKGPRGSTYEAWTKAGEAGFRGRSYTLREGDTIVLETVVLRQSEEGLLYIPTLRDQNNGQPVAFALRAISDTGMVFENPEHDFPQTISYTLVNPDSLVAEISGTLNGQVRARAFPMRRVR